MRARWAPVSGFPWRFAPGWVFSRFLCFGGAPSGLPGVGFVVRGGLVVLSAGVWVCVGLWRCVVGLGLALVVGNWVCVGVAFRGWLWGGFRWWAGGLPLVRWRFLGFAGGCAWGVNRWCGAVCVGGCACSRACFCACPCASWPWAVGCCLLRLIRGGALVWGCFPRCPRLLSGFRRA